MLGSYQNYDDGAVILCNSTKLEHLMKNLDFLESTLFNNFVLYNYIKFYMIKKHFYCLILNNLFINNLNK